MTVENLKVYSSTQSKSALSILGPLRITYKLQCQEASNEIPGYYRKRAFFSTSIIPGRMPIQRQSQIIWEPVAYRAISSETRGKLFT